jgi:hypothetical protein
MNKTIIASALALALFGSSVSLALAGTPVVSTTAYKADYQYSSIEELTALIAKLTAQLEEMKKNTAACFVSDKALSLGDGEVGDNLAGDVDRLQSFLREKGHFTFAKNTGFFGKITMTALVAFQNANGLSATGEFDAATRAKAHSLQCMKATVNNKIKDTTSYDKKKEEEKKAAEYNSGKKALTTIVATGDYYKVRWGLDGVPKNGIKIMWSKTSGPTYPPRSTDRAIHDSGESMKYAPEGFDGPGTYYVRICEYLENGTCGVYSNETTITIP